MWRWKDAITMMAVAIGVAACGGDGPSSNHGDPGIAVTPALLDFRATQGESDTRDLQITNTGTGTLTVDRFALAGEAFTLIVGQDSWTGSAQSSQGVDFSPPVEIAAGESTTFQVRFTPASPAPVYGELRLFSNDPDKSEGDKVTLQGNIGGPCLALSPKSIDFGGRLVQVPATITVELTSCGDTAVQVRGLRLMEDAEVPDITLSPDFALDLGQLPGIDPGTTAIVDGDPPLTLDVNVTAAFDVQFTPDEVNPTDPGGEPVPDITIIQVLSDTFTTEVRVEARGHGIAVECPTAVIKVTEGEAVTTGTNLHLIGSQSYAASGSISRYAWTVTRPAGSQSVFLPGADVADPTFEVDVEGTYVFELVVHDEADVPSCDAATYEVAVSQG